MGIKISPNIALVTTPTRLSGLLAKYGTRGSAKFQMGSSRKRFAVAVEMDLDDAGAFAAYDAEDAHYQSAVAGVRADLEGLGYPVINVPRDRLATFYFEMTEAVVVVGPDGLVANAAKYAHDRPIIGINPDPENIDGVLLPFGLGDVRRVTRRSLAGKQATERVTLGRVDLSDGQRLLAFNDFYLGRRTHVSARYLIYDGPRHERQSSSGVIVSTGAGSTGWLRSVYQMAGGIIGGDPRRSPTHPPPLARTERKLRYVVREPFPSRTTGTALITGEIEPDRPLRVESQMPEGGVIFSDGVEADAIDFPAGVIAEFGIADQTCELAVA